MKRGCWSASREADTQNTTRLLSMSVHQEIQYIKGGHVIITVHILYSTARFLVVTKGR